jgi:hypothetical protein
MIRCTNCSLNLKIIEVQNTPGPYLANPTQIKVGNSALKTPKNGQLLIESEKKSELEDVCKKISGVCREELESDMPTLKHPRMIVFMYQKTFHLRKQQTP